MDGIETSTNDMYSALFLFGAPLETLQTDTYMNKPAFQGPAAHGLKPTSDIETTKRSIVNSQGRPTTLRFYIFPRIGD